MKVRMKVDVSGTHDGEDWPPHGEVVDVSDEMGADLCAQGFAEPVAEKEQVEKAVDDEPVEKRRGRPPKPRDADGNIVRE